MPGDVVSVSGGEILPADLLLIDGKFLRRKYHTAVREETKADKHKNAEIAAGGVDCPNMPLLALLIGLAPAFHAWRRFIAS